MTTYRITAPDGQTYQIDGPPGASDADVIAAVIAQNPGMQSAPPAAKAAPFSLSDTAINAAQGAVGATKSIAEAFGAGNAPAEYLEGVQKSLGESLSPKRQAEMQRRKQLEDIANKSGKTLDEVAASLGGVKEAPIQAIAQGVGSSLPTVALGIGAGALGATLGAPVAIAAGVGLGVKYLIGALQGAGEVKGTVYDAVRDGLIAQGVPEEKAKERARESQNYIGENWSTIAGGAGLGAWAGGTGVESELLNKFSKPVAKKVAEQEAAKIAEKQAAKGVIGKAAEKVSDVTPGFVKAGAKEALPEGLQGGQSQYAENVAKTRAGMDTPAMQGVLGAAARDAAVGALTGSAVNPFAGKEEAAPPAAEPTPTATTEQPVEPTPEAPAAPRQYGELVREIERLKQEEQTPEIKAAIKALREEATAQTLAMVEEQRAAAAQEAADEEKAKGSAFAATEPQQVEMNLDGETAGTQLDLFGNPVQREEARAEEPAAEPEVKDKSQMTLGLRRTPEGQPTTTGQPEPTISAEDIMMTAIPLRTAAKWVEKNVAGRTLSQVADMVKRDPSLIAGKDPRAQLLKTLLQKEVPAFKETENVAPTEKPATRQVAEPRASEPSVGVPVEPAGVTTPAAAPVAGKPKAPVGRRLVPAGQPAGEGVKPEAAQPVALDETPAKPAVPTTVAKTPKAPAPAVATETVDEAAQRKKEAEEMRLAMEALDKSYAKGPKPKGVEKVAVAPKPAEEAKPAVAKTAAAAKRSEEAAQSDKDWQAVVDRVSKLKSPFEVLDLYKQNKDRKSRATLPGQTLDELKAEIAADKTSVGKAMARLMKSGKVELVDKSPIKGVGGEFDGSKVRLFADGIPKGHALAVALHEVGAHMGMKKMLGEAAYQKVSDRIIAMAKSKEASPERSLAQRALNRIPDEDVVRGKEVIDDEAIAYFVEELAKAEASGELPKVGPLRAIWNQIRAALVGTINRTFGTTFGMGDLTAEQIGAFASAAMTRESKTGIDTIAEAKRNFSVSPSSEAIITSMGPLGREDKHILLKGIDGFKADGGIDYVTQMRTQQADSAAAIESRFHKQFNGAVRDALGKLNPMGLYRQAQDHAKLLLEYFQRGAMEKNKTTGLWEVIDSKEAPIAVYKLIDEYAEKNGYTRDRATQIASRVLEAYRLDGLLKANPDFPSHMKPAEIASLVADYKADPAFAAMNAAMDKPRIAMIDHMVAVGRLTKEMAAEWKSVIGYVPFDRENIDELVTKFASRKKLTGKSPLAISNNPELVGSLKRPVGNVFDNYINTLGWMVKEVMNNDARVTTLKGLQDLGGAKDQKRDASGPNTVGAYINGEMNYWELPSKYDVMAFKDLNPPKWAIMRFLGEFCKILRTTVTVLPPFALKQVTDDVQRAIMTSGVKNVPALVRMSLTNFPKLAFAELRGIQHPYVKDFGALGLTGEFDFQEGRPADSLLADLGYKPRGKFKELIHRLNGITRASDLSVRKAIYDQTLIENKDKLLAQTRAREFINFRRRGASEFASVMTTTIPFYNSYVQGMDVLYRAASGIDSSSSVGRAEARKLFLSRAATVTMLSTIYALGKGDDDEDYNEMDLRTRDNNWILGDGIKLPVPGELGAVFKVIPERVVEYMRRQGTPEEQEAFEAVRTTLGYMFEQYVGRVMPIPQAAKPLLEAVTNHSFLTGRELEGIHQKGMTPSMRRTSGTSELAVAIAEFSRDNIGVEVSPIMIDNSLRGYFGSTAALVTMTTDALLNPTRMDRPLHKLALVSNYAYDPVGTRRATEFYEEREKVGQLNSTLNELIKTDVEAAGRFVEAHANELALASAINSTLDQIEHTRAYRKFLESKAAAEDMTQDERTANMEEVRRMEVEMVKWLREAKKEFRSQ